MKQFFLKNWRRLWFLPLVVLLLSLLAKTFFFPSGDRIHPRVGPMVEAVYGIGTVTARHTYQLKLGVSDTLTHLFVTEGDSVKKGQALIAFADNQMARAPFEGVVTSLPFKEGETVFPQVPVLTLTDLNNPYVVVSLEQSGALRVRQGQTAFLSFEDLRSDRLLGKVTSIYPKDGEFFVNIEVSRMPAELLVGMTADVAIQVAQRDQVLQIPLSTVDRGKVKLIRGGVTRTVEVKLGASDGLWGEVLEGDLHPEDLLLVTARAK